MSKSEGARGERPQQDRSGAKSGVNNAAKPAAIAQLTAHTKHCEKNAVKNAVNMPQSAAFVQAAARDSRIVPSL